MASMMCWWDEWRFNQDNNKPVFFIKHIINLFGCRVDLHKMVGSDDPECLHSHPAHAIRIILWGGYTEQKRVQLKKYLPSKVFLTTRSRWLPCMFGWVTPNFTHRIDKLNFKCSYSLWIRFRKTSDIKLTGEGWKKD